jgi:xanthine dehydrogenase molybdopterin-binding subunit B
MVLADGKVLFQNQEVAFVVAEDRYIADDAIQLVEVEYEELPVLSIRSRRWPTTLRSCAKTWKARPKAPTGRASITTTSSPGNRATRMRPKVLSEADVWPRK